MTDDLYSRWFSEMRRSGFFHPGQRVGVAVSGGPDSVLLFDFMKQLARELGLLLKVVHFNHRLRGAESDADEAFVRELAGGGLTGAVEFIRAEADVGRVAQETHRNLEATARELRYGFFFSLVDQGRVDKVATAHTANDQAETVLLKLLRGAGTRGLGGIYPVLEGKVVRPFLSLTRAEVEAEIARRGLAFRTDSSNRDARLARNKVRLELLPALARDFNPTVVKLLKEFADQARDDEAYLEQRASECARTWRVREGAQERIPLRALVEFPAAIERRVLRQMIGAVRGGLRGVTREHVEALRRFARESQSGRRLALPGKVTARKDFDWLVVALEVAPASGLYAYPVTVPGTVRVPETGTTFRFKIVSTGQQEGAYNKNGVVYLGGRKLSGKLVLRNWRAGDRFRPFGSRRIWKLKELFRRRKIEARARLYWPVLECDGQIVWVRGFSPDAGAATPTTGAVMTIEEEPRELTIDD
ncbi:MAG TPA: tRNA lysidine(34) synthetase TilS [Terriglobia bacterium]|nr:tRNA lysidine(34) synthetase TilS [Terriglobia bacterium]